MRRVTALGAGFFLVATVVTAAPAAAQPVVRTTVITSTDWTSGGVAGVGKAASGGGTGSIVISGVSGSVKRALLAWHGIGDVGPEGPYDNPNVMFDGTPVTGMSTGDSGSNCWGFIVPSRTYLADVTSIVSSVGANGAHLVGGLGDGGDANGAHLVVAYNDGNPANDRDLYLHYGNDGSATSLDQYLAETDGWSASLAGLDYAGGPAFVQLAVADGQQSSADPDDTAVTFASPGGSVTHNDTTSLFDGNSLPNSGHSRHPSGSGLYDLHTFDVTGAFGAPGVTDLTVSAPGGGGDCTAMTMAAVDLPAAPGSPPASPLSVSISPEKAAEGTGSGTFTKVPFRVVLSAKAPSAVTVTVHTLNGSAIAPGDYKTKTQTLTIAAGKRSKVFTVNVVPDSLMEDNEFFIAEITSASVAIGLNNATAAVLNDD